MTHPSGADLPVAARSELEVQLCEIWSEVLGRPVRDVTATFTELGGSSILAAMVAARIQQGLGTRVALATIFQSRTVQELARSIAGATAPAAAGDIPLVPLSDRGNAPMSLFQEWRFRADQGRTAPLYTIALGYELRGGLRREALRDTLSELARRHEPLRTNYDITAAGAVQVIHPPGPVELPVPDVRGPSEDRARADALKLLTEISAEPLDRRSAAMFQPVLARFADDGYILMLRLDRIAVDGTSLGLLEEELSSLYALFAAGGDPSFPAGGDPPFPAGDAGGDSPFSAGGGLPDPPALQQADWASWQRQLMRTPRMERAAEYWRRTLDGTRPLLEVPLPSGLRAPDGPSFRGRSAHRPLGADLSGELRRQARDAEVTLFMYLLAALKTFIARLTAQDTATIVCPFANRTRPELERMVGCFAHSVIYRTDLSGDPSFAEAVTRVRDVCLAAWEHQELPVSEVARHVRPVSWLTLYDEFHVFCDVIRDQPAVRMPGLDVTPAVVGTGAAHPSLAVFFDDGTGSIELIMRADADRFDDSALQWCLRELHCLLAAAAGEPGQRISQLPPSPESVRQRFGGS